MDLASLLVACSLHADDALLLSVAYVHSQGNPYAVRNVNLVVIEDQDDALFMLRPPRALDAARVVTAEILAIGGEPVLGLLPVRLEWAAEFGKTADALFEPCSDVAIASAKISEFDYMCRREGGRANGAARRACTLDLYGGHLGLAALRRIVMADLSVGDRGPEASSLLVGTPAPTVSNSGIFFAVASQPAALPLRTDSPWPPSRDVESLP